MSNDRQGRNAPESDGALNKGNQRPNEHGTNPVQKVVNQTKDKVDEILKKK